MVRQGSVGFVVTAIATISRDLGLVTLIAFLLWRNNETKDRIGLHLRGGVQDVIRGMVLFVVVFIAAGYLDQLLRAAGFSAPSTPTPKFLTAQGPAEYALALLLVAVVAVAEEIIFRGYLILRLTTVTGSSTVAIALSSIIFSLGHGYEGTAGVVTVGFMGLAFALVYVWTGSLVAPSFPMDEFRAFGIAATSFLPILASDDDLTDPLARRRHFDWAWQAVRYRYRSAGECGDEFKALLANPSGLWVAGWGDEEMMYKLERCIYMFFMSGLSVFESFGYCLYFLGGALQPDDFPHIATPRKISLGATSKAFAAVFPNAALTAQLGALLQTPEFMKIQECRNLLAHRLSGRRSVRGWSNGNACTHEETWHIPGSTDALRFSDDMLHRHLDEIASMLKPLTTGAREFAESQKSAAVPS